MKFDETTLIDTGARRKIVSCVKSSVVKVVVSPPFLPTDAAASSDDVSCSFFTHFYGFGSHALSFQALAFERVKLPDAWQFDLCIISTRPEHRDRYVSYRNDKCIQPLLLNRSINLLLSPVESNVVEAGEGWINERHHKKYFIGMQTLLAAREDPIHAWVGSFFFSYNRAEELLQPHSTMAAFVKIKSVVGIQSVCIQCSSNVGNQKEVDSLAYRFFEVRILHFQAFDSKVNFVSTGEYHGKSFSPSLPILIFIDNLASQCNPSHEEIEKVAFLMRSRWSLVARFIVPVFTEFEIREIEVMDREDQPARFIDAWIQKYRLDASREALCAALFAADLASSAKEVFPEIYDNVCHFYLADLFAMVPISLGSTF